MPITAPIAASVAGDYEIAAAPGAGYKYRVTAFLLSFGGTVTVTFRSAADDLTGPVYGILGAQVPSPTLPPVSERPASQFATAPGEALNLNLSGSAAVGGYVVYEKVPASM